MLITDGTLIKTICVKCKYLLIFLMLHFVMFPQMRLSFAAIAAIFTVEIANWGMRLEMHFQSSFFSEAFSAELTCERFNSTLIKNNKIEFYMKKLVDIKSIACSECAITAWMITFIEKKIFMDGIDVFFENSPVNEVLWAEFTLDLEKELTKCLL